MEGELFYWGLGRAYFPAGGPSPLAALFAVAGRLEAGSLEAGSWKLEAGSAIHNSQFNKYNMENEGRRE